MRDPGEGLAPDGTIRTGADRSRIPVAFAPVIDDVIAAFDEVAGEDSSLLLYGSVATGAARAGRSDVDLVAMGTAPEWCRSTARVLSARYSDLCRGVEIAPASSPDTRREDDGMSDDEAYGERVFLRHYCITVAGVEVAGSWTPFPGDARAARGFNGDIARCLARWRAEPAPARSIARKTLLAAAGIVSIEDGTWTTDRGAVAGRWSERRPADAEACALLLRWADDDNEATRAEVESVLATDGFVDRVTQRFADTIGLWP